MTAFSAKAFTTPNPPPTLCHSQPSLAFPNTVVVKNLNEKKKIQPGTHDKWEAWCESRSDLHRMVKSHLLASVIRLRYGRFFSSVPTVFKPAPS